MKPNGEMIDVEEAILGEKLSGSDPVSSRADLDQVLSRISFRPSCVDFGWAWKVREITCDTCQPRGVRRRGKNCVACRGTGIFGWLVATTFRRPDTDTGVVSTGRGRWEFIEAGTSVTGALKTCWICVEKTTYHELMEAFSFDGKRVFNPHKTVEELTHGEDER